MKTNLEKLPKSTVKLTVTIPSEDVKKTYEKLFDELVKNADIQGFRKGAAPKNLVKEKANISKLYGDVINDLLQTFYPEALKKLEISPVANPKVEIKEFDLEKEFEFVATIAVKPEVKVKDVRADLKKLYENKIENAPKDDKHVHLHPNDVIDVIVKNTEIEISDILVEDETDRLVSRLVNQAQAVGLSLEQYLKSQNKTQEQLRQEYKAIAEKNLIAEFAMTQLAKDEKVETTDQEIEELLAASGEENIMKKMQNPVEKWYIKNILEKNKLISKLIEETEGENSHANHEHHKQ